MSESVYSRTFSIYPVFLTVLLKWDFTEIWDVPQSAVYFSGYQPIGKADSVSEIKETGEAASSKGSCRRSWEMFSFLGCGVAAVGGRGHRPCGSRAGERITCWGLRERAARGWPGHSPRSSGARPAGGRTDGRTRGRARGGTPEARRWNAVFPGERDFVPEWRVVWGGVSHRSLLPTPGPPSRRFLGAFSELRSEV